MMILVCPGHDDDHHHHYDYSVMIMNSFIHLFQTNGTKRFSLFFFICPWLEQVWAFSIKQISSSSSSLFGFVFFLFWHKSIDYGYYTTHLLNSNIIFFIIFSINSSFFVSFEGFVAMDIFTYWFSFENVYILVVARQAGKHYHYCLIGHLV